MTPKGGTMARAIRLLRLTWWCLRWQMWIFWIGPYLILKTHRGIFWQYKPYCSDEGKPHGIEWGRRGPAGQA